MSTKNESEQVSKKRRVLAVEGTSRPYGLNCYVRGHAFASDKPESSGGADSGPDPFELLMGSLAACTAMTLRMYLDRRAVEVGKISVSVEYDDSSPPALPIFRRMISLDGPVDDIVLNRLRDIADRCPVHRVIAAGSRIETRFGDLCPKNAAEAT